jgi:hypothetical protein
VVATDERGIPAEAWLGNGPPGQAKYEIAALWPGKWTVRLKRDDEILATAEVTLAGTETVTCDLTVKPQ